MVVHLQIKPTFAPELLPLIIADLPAEPVSVPSQQTANSAYRLNWLPDGYRLLPQLSPVSGQTGQLLASWLLTDGLHQISVFVQPSSGLAAQAFRDGATTLLVKPRDQIDVVVIGPLQATLASQLADAVQ